MADEGLKDIEGQQIESNYDETVDNFDAMDLKAELLRGMFKLSIGFFLCSIRAKWPYQGLETVALTVSHRYLRIRFREAQCHSSPCYHSCH